MSTAEQLRLQAADRDDIAWKRWGPYLSERQWGTVREDYSDNGDAWGHFSHDQARSRAYRWGEDGIAGVSDAKQRLCFAVALWNGRDPILKERLFGLTNGEGNHGEDVKEYYYYLDSTPTHSYMEYLYKYPQREFPYQELVRVNRERKRTEFEYELLDTGVFADSRYWDVHVTFAKPSPEELAVRITIHNRGAEAAEIAVLPTLWFRNEWWLRRDLPRPKIGLHSSNESGVVFQAEHVRLGKRYLYGPPTTETLFTENESNLELLPGRPNEYPYVKDAFHRYIVNGEITAVNPAQIGTKSAPLYRLQIAGGASSTLTLLLSDRAPEQLAGHYAATLPALIDERKAEADAFYDTVIPRAFDGEHKRLMRQALAGMLWGKQFYYYDVERWLEERGAGPFQHPRRLGVRNDQWHHMYNADIISMPDKWEYPWYAAWDTAFHVTALSLVDAEFAKGQLDLMLQDRYQHPNGQIPAYEWCFGDVNPPVHAWSTLFTYRLQHLENKHDTAWLERSFQKLLMNFTWWVNRKDRNGQNVFEGGFLGLDNIGVFDRSRPLPTGGSLEQADGTGWMAFYCLNMLEIATELAKTDWTYAELAYKFLTHFLFISSAMSHAGGTTDMWDEEDGFFYDVLRHPDGRAERLKVRSLVGLLPLCAVSVLDCNLLEYFPEFEKRFRKFVEARPELLASIHDLRKPNADGRHMAAILSEDRLRRILEKLLDENEFLGPYGIRSLSKFHEDQPYVFPYGGHEYRVDYLPAESDSGMFGGNSNWRGPVWMPMNALIVRALLQYFTYYGKDWTVECPTGSGVQMNLYQVAHELVRRLTAIFLPDGAGKRPMYGGAETLQTDPHWRDHLLFFEYFNGDNGAGLGASHQTGWTGVIARLLHYFASLSADDLLNAERNCLFSVPIKRRAADGTGGSRRALL